jgi:hypothetical protein
MHPGRIAEPGPGQVRHERAGPARGRLEQGRAQRLGVGDVGLLLVIFALARSGRARSAPAAVGAYIGAAYWFTSSTSFANPAISVGRMFSNTFAGIAPSSVPSFIAAQILGGIVAAVVIKALYPAITPADAADIIVPHDSAGRAPSRAASDGTSPSADAPPGPVQSR